ncbi:MAG: SagB family peptide dehydrogenase [Pseudonocardia sp.]|nr:SagB family peptide dehydrogenase [Pseudonocardia sp.]
MDTNFVMFRGGVRISFETDSVELATPNSTFTLRSLRGGVVAALRALQKPVAMSALLDPLDRGDRVQFAAFLGRAGHLVARCVVVRGNELVRVEHTARDGDYRQQPPCPTDLVRLSKFAFSRSRSNLLVLESPLAKCRMVLLHGAARTLVATLGSAHTPAELACEGFPVPDVVVLLGHLIGAGFVETATAGEKFPSDEDPELRQWDFHDLLFHSRIRAGRYDDALGGVYPYIGDIDPQPALKTVPVGPVVPLYRPDLDSVLGRDPTLTVALEGRRSIRQYGSQPLTDQQIGEFLYRVGRTRVHYEGPADEMVSRPYPSGGSVFELELYLTVQRCSGLAPGIYYYDSVGHRLVLLNENAEDRTSMLTVASLATVLEADPDVLITITSRFQRVAWKYRGIAYATTLRHTGVLYQTMYLVATALGLAPCGLGIGNADLAARVLGLDYLIESSVGDFILGSRPSGELETWQVADGWRGVNNPDWAAFSNSILRPA